MNAVRRGAGRRDSDRPLAWRTGLARRWQAQPARLRRLLAVAAGLVLGTLVWRLALAPPLTLWREATAREQALELQLQRMQTLEAQARMLQPLPRTGRDDARRALEASVQQQFGTTARLQMAAEGGTLALTGARGEALAQWLAQARVDARVRPTAAQLTRNPSGLWDGQLTLALSAR